MNNLELFLKYNLKNTARLDYTKNETLDYLLFSKSTDLISFTKNQFNIFLYFSYDPNSFCPYNSNHQQQYENVIMSENTIKNIVNKIKDKIGDIIILGKEPLSLPDTLLQTLIEEKQKNNLNFKTSIYTNGLLYESKKELLTNLKIKPIFQFDGIKNIENKGNASTSCLLNLINKDKNIDIKNTFINSNLENNENIFINNYLYYKNLGIKKLHLRLINNFDYNNLTPIEINEQFIKQFSDYIEYWIFDTDNPLLEMTIIQEILRLFRNNLICWNKKNCLDMFCIDPLGNIGFCNCDLIEHNFGNINTIQSISDISSNNYYQRINYQIKNYTHRDCYNCPWYDACYGGCLGMNHKKDNSLHKIDRNYCTYTKFILSKIYNLIKNIDLNKDVNQYNPYLIQILRDNNYYSLNEIFAIEKKYQEEQD